MIMVASLPNLRHGKALSSVSSGKSATVTPKKAAPKIEWCGKYCIEQGDYTPNNVGNQALRNRFLAKQLQGCAKVQHTVSVPFGVMNEVFSMHYENVGPQGVISRALDNFTKHVENGTDTKELYRKMLQVCSRAARSVKLPEVMLNDMVDALVASRMYIPSDEAGWGVLRNNIAKCAAAAFTDGVMSGYEELKSPLLLPVGMLFKNQQPREYDFKVTVTSSGNISGEICMPFSRDQGQRFAAQPHGLRTTGLPKPHLGAIRDTSAVVLDGRDIPESLQLNHVTARARSTVPPKLTLEGDDLLILPRHRQAVYKVVADTGCAVAERMSTFERGSWVISGYITATTEAVVTEVERTVDDSLWGMWGL